MVQSTSANPDDDLHVGHVGITVLEEPPQQRPGNQFLDPDTRVKSAGRDTDQPFERPHHA